MLFSRGSGVGMDDEEEEKQEAPDILYSTAEIQRRRRMEKSLKKFQKIQNRQNVREYEENFHTKNYTNIRSKVFQIREKKQPSLNEKVVVNEKILIKRRVLNDYIHIVNKRQDVVDQMEDNFWTMVQLYDGTLHYFNKYYGKKLEDQTNKLNKMLKPEHRYLLKNIDRNEARIKRRILEYEQVKNSSDPRLKQALQECKNIDQILERNQEQQKNRASERRNKNKSEGHIEKLSKKKGYIVNEVEVEQRRQNQIVMNEVQKFGSDRIKRKLFEQDMKVILENQEIQDKIHQIQMSLDKMNAIQENQTQSNHLNPPNKSHHHIIINNNNNNNNLHNNNTNNHHQSPRDIQNTQEDTLQSKQNGQHHHNNPPSLQHIRMVSPSSITNLDFQTIYHQGNFGIQSAIQSPYSKSEFINVPLDESIINRRHSHNNLNPFLNHYGLQKSIISPRTKQLKEQLGLSQSMDRLSLNSIDEKDYYDDINHKKERRSSIFNMKYPQTSKKNHSISSSTQFHQGPYQLISSDQHLTLREQNLRNKSNEYEKNNHHTNKQQQQNNNIDLNEQLSQNSTPVEISQIKNRQHLDNLLLMNNHSKQQQSISIVNDQSTVLNTPQSKKEKKIKSVVSFVLPSPDSKILLSSTPQRNSLLPEKYSKSFTTTNSTLYNSNSNSESKFKFSSTNATVLPFSSTKKESVKSNNIKFNSSQLNQDVRKASLDQLIGRSSIDHNNQKNSDTLISITQTPNINNNNNNKNQQIQQNNDQKNQISHLKPALKKNMNNNNNSNNISSSEIISYSNINLKTQETLANNQISPDKLTIITTNPGISDQNIQLSSSNLLTQESPTKINNHRGFIKRLTTLAPKDSLTIGNLISKHKISKSMNSENILLSYNNLDDQNQISNRKSDLKLDSQDDKKLNLDENNNQELNTIQEQNKDNKIFIKDIKSQNDEENNSQISNNDEEIITSNRKDNSSKRRDTLRSDSNNKDKKRKKSMIEILGKKQTSPSLDKLTSLPSSSNDQVFEKPLIRNKIYNESDLFKYKKINQYAIQEIYEKRILNMQKDEAPLLTVSELQEIQEKQKKGIVKQSSQIMNHHNSKQHFSWNNLEEKKADFLSLEKQRSLYFNPEQEENFEKKITQLYGSDVFDKYKDIQKDCKTHLESSKSFQKDIKDGQSELSQKHSYLKRQYNENLGPKTYKSKYVKEILDQTKKQLNFKIKSKSRSLMSSPENILKNLLKKDKQTWGKTIQQEQFNNNNNNNVNQNEQQKEKKYNMFQNNELTENEKKEQRNKSMEQLEKIIDKYKQSSHSQSLKEQLNSLMNLDSKRKALFEMTQKMYQPNTFHKHKSKNKYIHGVLSATNIDHHTFVDLKTSIKEKAISKLNQSQSIHPSNLNNIVPLHSDQSITEEDSLHGN